MLPNGSGTNIIIFLHSADCPKKNVSWQKQNGTDMEKKDFAGLESSCQFRFLKVGFIYHVFSRENHPIIFHNEEEFKAAMNIVAFVAIMFPGIIIYTFEIMDNHFHFAIAGKKEDIEAFIKMLIEKLASHPSLAESRNEIKGLSFTMKSIDNLDTLRNVIAYNNRNGAVVCPDENVFTYRWGANRYFFNREARLRYDESGRKATCREKRKIFCSAQLDSADNVIMLDGYVSPLCYCHIHEAEMFFRNSRHYFHSVSRNVEAAKDIAKSIGESIFYTDEDLFSHVRMLCSKRYGCNSVSSLNSAAKTEIAKELHFDFNATNKQICRLLKVEQSIVNALFPKAR